MMITWIWALSLAGAGLMFSAGALFSAAQRARAFSALPLLPQPDVETDDDVPTAAFTANDAGLLERLLFAEADARATRLELEQQMTVLRATERQREELTTLEAQCRRLAEENRQLRARVLAAGVRHPAGVGRPATTTNAPEDGKGTPTLAAVRLFAPHLRRGDALQAFVDDLARREQVRAAVIADELGLVVAASGEHGDELAAAGVVVAHASAQAGQLLPVGKLREVTVRDEHDLMITVRPLVAQPGDDESDPLSIVTLALHGVSGSPDDQNRRKAHEQRQRPARAQ